jgi:hypothetical protein
VRINTKLEESNLKEYSLEKEIMGNPQKGGAYRDDRTKRTS